ncbi:predicted protein [Uncinocarpus reesii 1704]|uniref:Uncharacterized protein n=1 Tax=Uncinocarpus reesii (strain UAMH 1704) TaxID=336963 RepID=C4JK67_UNCRE|nr:uncharacterized protein UREG_02024 [Uncinocarpus reesii 1704]EEP77175.1 predicted protein [Uncinocarpus reesii 1704]
MGKSKQQGTLKKQSPEGHGGLMPPMEDSLPRSGLKAARTGPSRFFLQSCLPTRDVVIQRKITILLLDAMRADLLVGQIHDP